jgi:FHA domain
LSILGRGDFLGIQDKRCSRMQAELEVEESTRIVTLTTHGVNPTVVLRAGKKFFVGREQAMDLQDTDVLQVLDTYRMRVSIEGGVAVRPAPDGIVVVESARAGTGEPPAKKSKT